MSGAATIGALRVSLGLDGTQFQQGVGAANRSLGQMTAAARETGSIVQRSFGGMRGSLQNVGYQLQDVAVQMSAGTSASRALSMQLPQLLSGFGLFGVAVGTAAAVLLPMVGHLWDAGEATRSWADELDLTGGSINGVQGAVAALEGVQRQYNDAINATGGASSAAAALVVANSQREFAARKTVLGVELELLRIRGQEQASAAQNLSDGIRAQAEASATPRVDLRQVGMGGTDRAGNTIDNYVNMGPRNLNEMGLGDGFSQTIQRDQLAVQKLNAEMQITNLTIERTEALMDSTFATIGGAGGSGGTAPSGGGGGGGGGGKSRGGAPAAARAIREIGTAAEGVAQATEAVGSSFGSAFADAVTGAKDMKDVLRGLTDELARMAANSLWQGLWGNLTGGGGGGGLLASLGGLFGGIGKNANGTAGWRGGLSWVGERGPELMRLPAGSQVFDSQRSRQMMAGGAAAPQAVRVYVDRDGNWQAAVERIAGGVAGGVAAASARAQQRQLAPALANAQARGGVR